MSDIPIERKLELVHQLRSQYHKNQSDLMNREQILYGKQSIRENGYVNGTVYDMEENEQKSESTFMLRFALAAVLLGIIVLFDQLDKSIVGISMTQVFETIAIDYGNEMEKWVETLVSTK